MKTIGTTRLLPNTWYHVAAVFTPGSRQEVFVNGHSDGVTTSGVPPALVDTPFGVFLGAGVDEGVQYFDGVLDEVRIWARALTAQQIQDDMHASSPTAPGVVGAWNFNEGSGTIARDSSGHGHDGTIVGAVWTSGFPF